MSAAALVQELRTPLTSVHGFLETLLLHGEELEPALAERMLSIAYRNSALLSQRVAEIIELQRIWDGAVRLDAQPVDLLASLREFVQDREGMLASHELVSDVDEGVKVWADPQALRHVFSNVIGDAVRHSRPGSTISIIGLEQDDQVMVLVSDGGDTIDPEDLPTVFIPEYHGHPARRGCGIGLAVAYEYVTALGGEINVRSEAGHGTTVWFHLPRASATGLSIVRDGVES